METHGLNYLVPVDAHPQDEADVFVQMVGISGILDQMEKSGTRINLVLLDACRDNPFRDHGVRSTTGGLAQMPAPVGTLISFATQPRSVSLDGDDGHSPYTSALAEAMQRPGSGLFKTFNEVGLAVEKATGGPQLPWVSSSPISGNFYFAGKPAAVEARPAPTPPDTPAPTAARSGSAALAAGRSVAPRSLTDCDRLAAMPYDTGHRAELPASKSTRSMSRRRQPPATTRCSAIRMWRDLSSRPDAWPPRARIMPRRGVSTSKPRRPVTPWR